MKYSEFLSKKQFDDPQDGLSIIPKLSPLLFDFQKAIVRWNQGVKYHLAIVLVGEDESIDGPHFVPHPFKEEPGWGVSSVNYDLKALLERAICV